MPQSPDPAPKPPASSDGVGKLVVWEPGTLTHLLALSSDLAEDRELLRAYGVGAQHWVHKPRTES